MEIFYTFPVLFFMFLEGKNAENAKAIIRCWAPDFIAPIYEQGFMPALEKLYN